MSLPSSSRPFPAPLITWPTIVIFGDSITEGAGDETGRGWADMLKANWKIPRPHESGFPAGSAHPNVYNLGIDGDRTVDVLNRFEFEVAARRPRGIILAIGANDLHWDDPRPVTGLAPFAAQYNQLLLRAVASADQVLVMNLFRVDESAGQHGVSNAEIDTFNEAIRQSALQHAVELLDVSQLLGPSDYCDGIHPNHSGAEKIYQIVSAKLAELTWDKL